MATGRCSSRIRASVSLLTRQARASKVRWQQAVARVILYRLAQRPLAPESPPAEVPPPPVQLPPIADSIYNFLMRSFTEAQQPTALPNPCAVPQISVSSSVDLASAYV